MIEDIRDQDEGSFLRHWAERVWDRSQLAQIAAIEDDLVHYATTAWRSMNILPPESVLLLCACEEGLVLMSCNGLGEWRSSQGLPHKPPRAWMPSPKLPSGTSGDGR